MSIDSRTSRTQRLQWKVKQLEEELRRAEEAERESSKRSANWTDAVLSGKVNIPRAPLQPLVACYPAPLVEHNYPRYLASAIEEEKKVECVSLVPRHGIHQDLLAWDQTTELSEDLRNMLLSIFFPHRDQFNFDLNIQHFRKTIRLPASDPNSFHPCLVYAVCLAACSCAGPDLRAFEKLFLERTQTECELALANVDRLEDFMWASVVLGWYWCRTGKVINAHAVSTTVAHWAIACGLHSISDPAEYLKNPSPEAGLLGPLRDLVHFEERINLWWAVFILDRRVALVTGLPPLIQENSKIITTVWPRSCNDVDRNRSPSAWHRESINELFLHGSHCADVSKDSLLCLRAKAGALLDGAMWISHLSKSHSTTNIYWTMHLSIDNALIRVLKTFPEITDQREILQGEEGKRLNPSLVLARSYVHTAVIVLHSIDADPVRNPIAYEKCLMASRRMANDVRLVGNTSFMYSHACLGPTWSSGAEVCAREVRRLTPPTSHEMEKRLREYRKDLDSYIRGLTWLVSHYPDMTTFLARLGDILQESRDVASSPATTTISTPLPHPSIRV